MIIAFHKPYGVLSQFSPDGSDNDTLAGFSFPKDVYPLGRLDSDSEGLLLLSDEKKLNARILLPENAHRRTYYVQVENIPSDTDLEPLRQGLLIQGRKTLPAKAWLPEPQPEFPERVPPIRERKSIPTCWIALELVEGKNRQVRRMTAAIGYPTLRLIRTGIGDFELGNLQPGEWKKLSDTERQRIFAK